MSQILHNVAAHLVDSNVADRGDEPGEVLVVGCGGSTRLAVYAMPSDTMLHVHIVRNDAQSVPSWSTLDPKPILIINVAAIGPRNTARIFSALRTQIIANREEWRSRGTG